MTSASDVIHTCCLPRVLTLQLSVYGSTRHEETDMTSASEAGRSPRASSETESTAAQRSATQSKRGSIMSVRFRPDERQRVAEAAGMFEVSPSAFVRAAAIDAVDAVRTASASADVPG